MMKLFILIMMVWAIFAIKAISLNDVTFKSLNDPITKTNFNKLNSNGPEQQHNTEEEKIFHVWCVSAFTKDYSTEPWHSVVDALIYGINLYGKHNNITKYDIKTVFKEEYVFTTNDSSLLRSNDSTHFESLSENEAFANSQFNKRLLKIPWSGALEEANSNIIAVIILTDYYAENLVTINGSQSLIGQMFIYNETTFESYNNAEKLKNSTQFHFYYLPSEVANITVVPITIPKHSPLNTSNTLNTSTKIFIICGSCACVFIIIFIGFLFYRRKKRKENIERMLQNALKKQSERRHIEPTTSIYDNWELTWERLVIKNDELSTGIHEQLLHGTLLSDFRNGAFQENSEVAIKMPNKYALEITKEKFLDEIYMMKKVTGDRNIIAMVGCITHEDQICLVMEFCANLDLLNYVREIKYNEKKMEENEKQTKKEFFIFGWQILHGLQYLKSKFIIHRNLTAKNILITADKNAKITDFGLAIHESNKTESLSIYEKLRLPLKWLSIEALKNYTFSFESDIWAFGIILYEMYSFGEEPYAEIDTDELLEYLKAKKRLEKPNQCFTKSIKNSASKCDNQNNSNNKSQIQTSINDFPHDLQSPVEICETLIIFDLSKKVTTKEIFDSAIKAFLRSVTEHCNSFKYVIINENFNECGSQDGCKINVHNCNSTNKCNDIVNNLNYNNMSTSYPDEIYEGNSQESKNYINFLRQLFVDFCPCKDNSVIVLTNRILYIHSDQDVKKMVEYSSIKFMTILLGRNDFNAQELLENSNSNIPNSRAVNFANFDCLSYLFYCLLPCSSNTPDCMQTDVNDCQIVTTKPNDNLKETLHLWIVTAFNKPFSDDDYYQMLDSLQTAIQDFVIMNDIKQVRLRLVYDDEDISNSYEDINQFFNDFSTYYTLQSGDVNTDIEINQRLDLVPWSGTLTETRIGINSVIILTKYATENLTLSKNGQNFQGQMYIYNEIGYDYYLKKLKNDTNFHFILQKSFSDPIVIIPIKYGSQTTTIPIKAATEVITESYASTSTETYEPDANNATTTIQNLKEKSSSNTAMILIICGSVIIIIIIVAVIGFKYYKMRRRDADIEWMQTVHGRRSNRRHIEPTTSIYDNWELTWERLVIKNDELSTGIHEQLLHGTLLSDFRNGDFQESSEVAIKMPNKYALEITKGRFLNEINMMKKITGDNNIIEMLGCITKGDRICLVLELCANIDLLNFVKETKQNKKKMEENEKQTKKEFFIFGWQILHGLQYLKSKFIIHRNLTAKNILITAEKNAKIADFGLAIHESEAADIVSVFEKRKFSKRWLAIESLEDYIFSFESDIWAFGIVLFETYSFGEIPYENIEDDELLDYLEAEKRLEKPAFCSDKVYETMLKTWNEVPVTRPKVEEIIKVFVEVLEDATEGYGYLELIESAASNKNQELLRQLSSYGNPQ